MRSVLLPLPRVTSDRILLTQSYTPAKLQLWTLNSGQQALITVLSSCTLNARLLHTHPTQSGKHHTCLQTVTRPGQVHQPMLARCSVCPIVDPEKQKRETISQFGFFGVPQTVAVLLHKCTHPRHSFITRVWFCFGQAYF